MNKKIPLGAVLAFMAIIAGVTFCITMMVSLNYFNTKVLEVKEREETYNRLADIDRESRQSYDGNIDEDTLNNAISSGYITGLSDKYASYYNKSQYVSYLGQKNNTLIPIGVSVAKDTTGYLVVNEVQSNTPADTAGIQVGDLILSIGETDVRTYTLMDAEYALMGNAGTKVDITYRRNGEDTTVNIQRKAFEVMYISTELIGSNGYIKVKSFEDATGSQIKNAITSLIQQGATGIIFDLRDCSSGDSMWAATTVLDRLLPAVTMGSRVIVKTNTVLEEYSSDSESTDLPVAVLVNGRTAGVAEYFASVIQDRDIGSMVGTTTYGKSALQEVIPLTEGGAIKITTSHFLTVNGINLEGIGLTPTYEVQADTSESLDGESVDAQLQKAIEVVNSQTAGSSVSSSTQE